MIEKGKKVKINYKLTVDGEVLDNSFEREPLEYEQGSGQIIPGLERELEGLREGDRKEVDVLSKDGYGERNDEAVIEIDRDQIQAQDINVGSVLSGTNPDGKQLQGVVKEVTDSKVQVDFNHPLAGKNLHFEVEVLAIA